MRFLSDVRSQGAIALFVIVASISVGAEQTAPRVVTDGVYTIAQAERGKTTYAAYCSACHQADLSGGVPFGDDLTPALVDKTFMGGRDMTNVLETIKKSMPADSPGILTDQAYLDVIAFVLERNSIPAGAQELRPRNGLEYDPLPPTLALTFATPTQKTRENDDANVPWRQTAWRCPPGTTSPVSSVTG